MEATHFLLLSTTILNDYLVLCNSYCGSYSDCQMYRGVIA